MKLNVLIIEDEAAAARRLEKMLKEIDPEITVLDQLDSVETSVEWLQSNENPDLIFSDIELADGSGLEIFREVVINCPVIFVTAYDKYAVEAFKVNSIDYILKPLKRPELAECLDKFHRQKQQIPAIDYELLAEMVIKKQPVYQKRIVIRFGQHIKAIEISEVAYFFIESKITLLNTYNGKQYPVDYNLDQLEGILDPVRFFRINRSMTVCIDAIENMYAYSKSRVKLILKPPTDSETIVSTERSPHFKKWLLGKRK